MDRKKARFTLKRLRYVKTWQLVLILILFGFISATFLRLNNIGMDQRRQAVLQSDKTSDQQAIKARLYDLQRFVTAHMNTDMGSVFLEGSYNRAAQGAWDSASGKSAHGNIYKKAQEVCAPRFTHYSTAYLQCTMSYLEQYAPAEDPGAGFHMPLKDAYTFSYVSPIWSPDFAGFSLLICLIIVFIIIARLTGVAILKMVIKRRSSGV